MTRASLLAYIVVVVALCGVSASHAEDPFIKELPWKLPEAQAAVAAVPVPSHPSLVTFTMRGAYADCEVSRKTPFTGPRDVAGYEPKNEGKYPVFIYLAGTLMRFNGPEAKLMTSEMAKRGFVAAAVDYDSFAYSYCPAMKAKAKCIFDGASKSSALSQVCSRAKADCKRGVVLAGFSQGANLAALAANESELIKAAYLIGHGDNALHQINVSPCADDSATALSASQMRSVNGESDAIFGSNAAGVRKQLQKVVGTTCADALDCEGERGAGWHIAPSRAVADGVADHCYFFHKANIFCSVFDGFDPVWQSGDAPWSLGPNLDWLARQLTSAPSASSMASGTPLK